MAQTVADRLKAEADRAFVGRTAELTRLKRGITDPTGFVVAHVHGPGGVGKSRLLQKLLEEIRDDAASVWLDCAQIEPTPRGFTRALTEALGHEVPSATAEDAAEVVGEAGALVIVLDVYETFGLMDGWLRNTFVPLLPAGATIVIAGRNAPSPAWLTTPGWETLFLSIELTGLEPDEATEMLSRRGLDASAINRISLFAHGHPLALELAAAAFKARPDLEVASGPPPEVLGQLSTAFLSGLSPAVAEAAEAGATVRRITSPLLDALLDGHADQALLDSLRDLPFVEAKVEGLAFHDLVRDTISAELARRDPDRHREYRRRAWMFLTQESHRTAALNLWQHTADLLFLFQNPYLREAFFPAGAAEVSMERADPAHGDAILEIVHGTAQNEAEALRAWWDHQPEAFHVARDRSGDVVAFYILVEAGALKEEVRDADPVVRAWLEHLAENPVADGEMVLLFRRWLTESVGEGPSPAQAASWLDVKRTYMELRPDLRRLYTGACDLSGYAPTLVPLGMRPIPEADVEMNGIPIHGVVLDFGDDSVDGWFRNLIGEELGADFDRAADGPDELPEGTVTILFTDIAESTRLTEEMGDTGFRELARRLDTEVRVAVSETGGVPVEGLLLGDGLMAVFTSAGRAIEGARRARAAADAVGLGLHVGLHAGDVIREGHNVFGGAVNIAARVADLAAPGEIVATGTVRALASTSANAEFQSRGPHQLKGVRDRQEIFEVEVSRDREAVVSTA